MLLSLKVKNYALIKDVDLRFNRGLNIITGETGAGKSILIGALGLTLGKRADTSALRNQDEKCVIEAEFDISNYGMEAFFTENDIDFEKLTLVRREITTSGRSRAFINDTPTTLIALVQFGEGLIEIHSQHDNLQLFKKDFQFLVLDTLANTHKEQAVYREKYNRFKREQEDLISLKNKAAAWQNEQEFKQFQYNELEQANLEQINEAELTAEQERLENAEELIRVYAEAAQLTDGEEYGIISQLQALRQLLRSQNTQTTSQLAERIDSVLIELQDVSSEIEREADAIEINPERLLEVNEQLSAFFNLKQKHRKENLEELLAYKQELEDQLQEGNNLDLEIAQQEKHLEEVRKNLEKIAESLHQQRTAVKPSIEEKLATMLHQLGMEHSYLSFNLEQQNDLGIYGKDTLSINLSSDKGATFNPLQKSASGGELARINLSIKHALSGQMALSTSIFDEIDTGVSGEIARKVGGIMNSISQSQQVIVVTHLPQIASLGNNHLFVYKREEDGLVQTQVRVLDKEERVREIAKMISGEDLTEHALEQSKALLEA
jgi:DNA repair protein RecN (Recombination protein N)